MTGSSRFGSGECVSVGRLRRAFWFLELLKGTFASLSAVSWLYNVQVRFDFTIHRKESNFWNGISIVRLIQ